MRRSKPFIDEVMPMDSNQFYIELCKALGLENVQSFSLHGAVGKPAVLHVSQRLDGKKQSKILQLIGDFTDVSEHSSNQEKT